MSEPLIRVGVVGTGPRGTVILERICANAELLAPGSRIEVHLIDPFPAGGGRVWREDQHRALLMNTVASDVTVFTDDTVQCVGPIRKGPTQYEWSRLVAAGEVADQDERTVAEAAGMRPWSYASRAFQGGYLRWALAYITANAPAGVSVHVHRTRAVALADVPGGRQSLWLEDQAEPLTVDAVVLSQGHFEVDPTDSERALLAFAGRHGLVYQPPANPGEVDLAAIAAGEPVILRGLGLNFFDYMALFTVARGGRFERSGERLVYRPSGAEPILYAGSGRGVPYTARAETQLEVVPRYNPRFLTAPVIAELRRAAGTGRTDFMTHLWPLVAKETGWVYYQHLLAHSEIADAAALERLRAEYPALDWGSEPMEALLAELVPDRAMRWDWAKLDRPAAGLHFASRTDYLGWVHQRLRQDYLHSRLGPAGSAVKATAAVLRDLRDEVRQVVSHRGISGSSYRQHLDGWFSGLNNFISSGPPASRVEELIALVEAGVVHFVGPGMRVVANEQAGVFRTHSPSIDEPPVRAGALVEAHLPLTDLRRVSDPLLRFLLDRGQCRPHRIPNADGSSLETGGLDITEGAQRLVDVHGVPHRGRFSYGPPVESVQWVTAIGARPHVGSRTLTQGDAIARAALTTGVQNLAAEARSVGTSVAA